MKTKQKMVTVHFFKEGSGKWYTTERMPWESEKDDLIHDSFRRTLAKHVGRRLTGMRAVCLKPAHIYSHPIMVLWVA